MSRAALVAMVLIVCAVGALAQQRQPATIPPSKPSAPSAAVKPPPSTPSPEQPPQPEQRGTEDRPVVVKVLPAEKAAAERQQDAEDRLERASSDRWIVRLTGALAIVGLMQFGALAVQIFVFRNQANALRDSVNLTRQVSERQEQEMADSIAQAMRAATAMEGVATTMAANVENVRASVATQREIADRQKLLGELQSRAYLSVVLVGVVPQNEETGYRFEPRVGLVNNGNTPAKDVRFRSAADVQPFPLQANFEFPLPESSPAGSVSIIGPRQNKLLSSPVPRIYSKEEVQAIKAGVAQRIYMWGEVTYTDVFGLDRFLRFCQSFVWLQDGTTVMGFDTNRHNDAN